MLFSSTIGYLSLAVTVGEALGVVNAVVWTLSVVVPGVVVFGKRSEIGFPFTSVTADDETPLVTVFCNSVVVTPIFFVSVDAVPVFCGLVVLAAVLTAVVLTSLRLVVVSNPSLVVAGTSLSAQYDS